MQIKCTFVIMEINARIRMIIESHRLTAGAFADKIGVQRSNVSHVLSGRNKPSFEFLEKVLVAFPKVSALWLITGKQERETEYVNLDKKAVSSSSVILSEPETVDQKERVGKKLIKTVLFYDDFTCEEYLVNPQ